MGTRARVLAVIALVVAVIVVLVLLLDEDDDGKGGARPVVPPRSGLVVEPTGRTLAAAPVEDPCAPVARRPFEPVEVQVPGLGPRRIIGVPRAANGATGVPPVTSAGKHLVAWDLGGVRPGSAAGNVLLNAHTWPDGSALGNQLLRVLDEGEVLALRGAGGQVLCYRVTERVEVPFDLPSDRYYDDAGPAQVAIAVCSGTRAGPGEWTHRTLWFGEPVR